MAYKSKQQSIQPEYSFENGIKLKILKDLLDQLGECEKTVIHLRFWECMTIEQIASCVHLSWATTDKLIESTLAKLREKILEQMDTTDLQAA